MRTDLLARLTEAHGTSGREGRVREIVEAELRESCDRLEPDPLGGVAGVREGSGGPRLMLAAHMDEIGLMVTHVTEGGFLRFTPIGGWDARTLVAQRVVVHGREELDGVVGTVPVHLLSEDERKAAPKLDDLAVDVGLPGERVRELVRPGDTITRARRLRPLGELLTGKSLDDRVGLFVMLEGVRTAARGAATVLATATVQEEVGLRGARVAAGRLRPQVAVAIDTCNAVDGPGGGTRDGSSATKLGEGAAIRIMDASAIGAPALVELLTRIARERGIPHQFHVADKGGTDTGAVQLSGDGAVAGCVSIPTRYVHSSVETVHPGDVQAAIDLVAGLVERVGELPPAA